MPYIASYDFGTSSVKVVLVDFFGNISGSASASYTLLTPRDDWAEQDPEQFWAAACAATKQVCKEINPKDVKAVAFGSQWKAVIPVDKWGNVLHNALIWLDGRAGKQAEELNRRMGSDKLCNKDYWAKLMWIMEERPDIYEKTETFLEVNSFIKFRATGVKAVDISNDFIHAIDPEVQKEYDEIISAAGLDITKFPPQVKPTFQVGELTNKAADELGLSKGTAVFGGCGDIPAIAIGAGCSRVGSMHLNIGSSGWAGIVMEKRLTEGELHQSLDVGREITLNALQAASMTFNKAIELFYRHEKETMGEGIFTFLEEETKCVPPGSLNMIATPWPFGERPPLSNEARTVFFNVTNLHERKHFINAVMEGVYMHLRWKLELLEAGAGKKADAIRAVGGGASSSHWMQILSNILQIPVYIPENATHSGAIGTAVCALIGLGELGGFDDAERMVSIERGFEPQKEHKDVYDRNYDVFLKLYPTTKGLFTALNRVK